MSVPPLVKESNRESNAAEYNSKGANESYFPFNSREIKAKTEKQKIMSRPLKVKPTLRNPSPGLHVAPSTQPLVPRFASNTTALSSSGSVPQPPSTSPSSAAALSGPSPRRVAMLMCASFAAILFVLFGVGGSRGGSAVDTTVTPMGENNNRHSMNRQTLPPPPPPPPPTLSPAEVARREALSFQRAHIGREEARLAELQQELAGDRRGDRSSPRQQRLVGGGGFPSDNNRSRNNDVITMAEMHAAQYENVENIVFSCFYDNSWVNEVETSTDKLKEKINGGGDGGKPTREAVQRFYVGERKVPPLDWVEVFLRSVEDTTRSRRPLKKRAAKQKRATDGKSEGLLSPEEIASIGDNKTRVVFFVDLMTWKRMRHRVADLSFKPYKYLVKELASLKGSNAIREMKDQLEAAEEDGSSPVFVDKIGRDSNINVNSVLKYHRRPLVHFVVVAFPKDEPLLRSALDVLPLDQQPPDIVVPAYLNSQWAMEVRNGANNFRFALYRDWLTRFVAHNHGGYDKGNFPKAFAHFAKAFHATAASPSAASAAASDQQANTYPFVESLLDLKIVVADATDVAFQRNPFKTSSAVARSAKSGGGADVLIGGPSAYGSCFGNPQVVSAIGADSNDDDLKAAREEDAHASRRRGALPRQRVPIVIATLENSRQTYKKEKYNRNWMKCYNGGKDLERLARQKKQIACAGVTMGNGAGMFSYFTAQLLQIVRPSLVQCSLQVISAALDQATHNYLLHSLVREGAVPREEVRSALGKDIAEQLFAADGSGLHKTLALFPSPATNGEEEVVEEGRAELLPLSSPENPTPFFKRAPFPVKVVLTHHERDHCTFHGNFGQLKTITVPLSEALGGDASLSSSSSSSSSSEDTTVLAVNGDGHVYDIVHQYSSDRHPPLMAALRKRYLTRRSAKRS